MATMWGLLFLVSVAALVLAVVAVRSSRTDAVDALRLQIERIDNQREQLSAANRAVVGRVHELELAVSSEKAGPAPLAARILRSVFTVQTSDGLGTGWVGWTEGRSTFFITAAHVVTGERVVRLQKGGRVLRGTVYDVDAVNDIAVIRVARLNVAPSLWQDPTRADIAVGDEVLLVGSPAGLEGTVTTGIVSRVTYNRIQTDAAANPGNSGGPVIDRDGDVLGVISYKASASSENLNFAIPIARACVKLRRC
jgi:putative serine protease PepD